MCGSSTLCAWTMRSSSGLRLRAIVMPGARSTTGMPIVCTTTAGPSCAIGTRPRTRCMTPSSPLPPNCISCATHRACDRGCTPFAVRRRSPERDAARELPTDELPEMTAPTDADDTDVDYLRQLVWDAAGGLAPRDRAVLDLHLRQGLQGQELAAALGVKEHHATVLLGRVREHVDRSLGALLVARTGRRDCRELDELLSGWDGSLSPLLRKRVARHIDNCDVCGERRRRMVSPAALLAGVPILPAPGYLRDRVLDDVALASSSSADGQYLTTRVQHWAPLVAAAVVAALIVAGAACFTLRPTTAPVSATEDAPSLTPEVAPSASATPGTILTVPSQEPTATATASTSVASPGVIELLTDAVDFGGTSTEASLQFRNTGGSELLWTLSLQDGALAASTASGSLASGEAVDITLTLDRDSLAEGEFSSTIDISGAGSFSVPVSASVERAPVISGLRASRGFIVFGSAAGRCTTVQVAATVTDDSDVTVSLFWQSGGWRQRNQDGRHQRLTLRRRRSGGNAGRRRHPLVGHRH